MLIYRSLDNFIRKSLFVVTIIFIYTKRCQLDIFPGNRIHGTFIGRHKTLDVRNVRQSAIFTMQRIFLDIDGYFQVPPVFKLPISFLKRNPDNFFLHHVLHFQLRLFANKKKAFDICMRSRIIMNLKKNQGLNCKRCRRKVVKCSNKKTTKLVIGLRSRSISKS